MSVKCSSELGTKRKLVKKACQKVLNEILKPFSAVIPKKTATLVFLSKNIQKKYFDEENAVLASMIETFCQKVGKSCSEN